MVSSTPRPHFTLGKDTVPILQEAGWTPESAWTGGKSRPHRDSIPDRTVLSQSLYRLSYALKSSTLGVHEQHEVCLSTEGFKPFDRFSRNVRPIFTSNLTDFHEPFDRFSRTILQMFTNNWADFHEQFDRFSGTMTDFHEPRGGNCIVEGHSTAVFPLFRIRSSNNMADAKLYFPEAIIASFNVPKLMYGDRAGEST